LLLAWGLRPRFPKRPKNVLPRDAAPATYEFVSMVGAHLGAGIVDGIVVTPWFNAGLGRVGWRRKTILYLGLPLTRVLEPDEFVALLGHEIGHRVNGDPTRGAVVGTALVTLRSWYVFTYPRQVHTAVQLLATLPLIVASTGARMVWTALIHLSFRDSQRAE